MERFLGRYSSYIYAILRIVVGFLFMQHGTLTFFGFPPPPPGMPVPPLDTLMMVAGGLELVLGLLVLIGLFTSIAAFIASGEMAVAYFMAHQPMGALPITNLGETAALYAFIFLYIAATGAGIWSVDAATRGTSIRSADGT
jgi:putative oxidoreductase